MMELDVVDFYCGAGGSTTGLKAAGLNVIQAANHWELAIKTHAENHPETRHACVDLHQEHPASFRRSMLLWASPECRVHSPAGGRKRKSPGQMHLWENTAPKPADVRSRMTAWDVLRSVEFHRQPYICVENVVEFAEWELFDNWLGCFHKLGYRHQLLSFNSQFAGVPQSRDRLYIVFHHEGEHAPNIDFQPEGYCEHCGTRTRFAQSWKNPHRRAGRYGRRQQYIYRCVRCGREGVPDRRGSREAIDWSLPTVRIGDREKLGLRPLSPNTLRRIEKGLKRFFPEQFLLSNRADNVATGLSEPSKTVTASGQPWLVEPFLVNRGFSTAAEDDRICDLHQPAPTVTTTGKFAVAQPFLDVLRRNSTPISVTQPSATVTAQGNHHAVVQPFLSGYYGNGGSDAIVDHPSPTVRAGQSHALIEPDWSLMVEDCGYRMLKPHEAKVLMGFPVDYTLLGNQREQFKQAGNAVTPGVAALIGQAIKQAVSAQRWV